MKLSLDFKSTCGPPYGILLVRVPSTFFHFLSIRSSATPSREFVPNIVRNTPTLSFHTYFFLRRFVGPAARHCKNELKGQKIYIFQTLLEGFACPPHLDWRRGGREVRARRVNSCTFPPLTVLKFILICYLYVSLEGYCISFRMRETTSSSFDPYSWRNFYFHVDREEATRLLCQPDADLGTFLIRDSTTPGSYALSVRYLFSLHFKFAYFCQAVL